MMAEGASLLFSWRRPSSWRERDMWRVISFLGWFYWLFFQRERRELYERSRVWRIWWIAKKEQKNCRGLLRRGSFFFLSSFLCVVKGLKLVVWGLATEVFKREKRGSRERCWCDQLAADVRWVILFSFGYDDDKESWVCDVLDLVDSFKHSLLIFWLS